MLMCVSGFSTILRRLDTLDTRRRPPRPRPAPAFVFVQASAEPTKRKTSGTNSTALGPHSQRPSVMRRAGGKRCEPPDSRPGCSPTASLALQIGPARPARVVPRHVAKNARTRHPAGSAPAACSTAARKETNSVRRRHRSCLTPTTPRVSWQAADDLLVFEPRCRRRRRPKVRRATRTRRRRVQSPTARATIRLCARMVLPRVPVPTAILHASPAAQRLHRARRLGTACIAARVAASRPRQMASPHRTRTARVPRRPPDQKETTREEEPSRQRSRHEMAHHRDPGARDPGGDCTVRVLCVCRALSRCGAWCVLVATSCSHQRRGDALLFAEQHLTTPSEQKYNSGERSEGTRVVKMRSACATIPKNAQPASEAET